MWCEIDHFDHFTSKVIFSENTANIDFVYRNFFVGNFIVQIFVSIEKCRTNSPNGDKCKKLP